MDTEATEVTALYWQECVEPGAGTLGPPQPVDSPVAPQWPVGIDLGTPQGDTVETCLEMAGLSNLDAIRLGVIARGPTSEDVLLTHNGLPDGDPIILGELRPAAGIPALSDLGMVVLPLLMTMAGL